MDALSDHQRTVHGPETCMAYFSSTSAHFWIVCDLGGVSHCQDDDSQSHPTRLQTRSAGNQCMADPKQGNNNFLCPPFGDCHNDILKLAPVSHSINIFPHRVKHQTTILTFIVSVIRVPDVTLEK